MKNLEPTHRHICFVFPSYTKPRSAQAASCEGLCAGWGRPLVGYPVTTSHLVKNLSPPIRYSWFSKMVCLRNSDPKWERFCRMVNMNLCPMGFCVGILWSKKLSLHKKLLSTGTMGHQQSSKIREANGEQTASVFPNHIDGLGRPMM